MTALLVAVARDLPLVKRGEFRVASGAVIQNWCKIKMKSTDESGVARSIRGHITEVAKPLLSAAEVSRRSDSLLFEGGIFITRFSCCFGGPSNLGQAQRLESSWQEHLIFTGKATETTRTCKLAMSHQSLHRSNQPRRAGPGWTWTMEIMR